MLLRDILVALAVLVAVLPVLGCRAAGGCSPDGAGRIVEVASAETALAHRDGAGVPSPTAHGSRPRTVLTSGSNWPIDAAPLTMPTPISYPPCFATSPDVPK
jgi:hypothetical protein